MSEPRHWLVSPVRNELDMLYCQLYEHGDKYKGIVVAEAPINHQGRPKPLYFTENLWRFTPWLSKLIVIVCDWLPPAEACSDPWVRERMQRDAPLDFLRANVLPDDIIVNADIDEIPSDAAMAAIPSPDHPILGLLMKLHFAAVDWPGGPGVNPTLVRGQRILDGDSLDVIRQHRAQFPVVEDAGWHLSWFGGKDEITDKLHSFCHTETFEYGMKVNEHDEMYRLGKGHPDNEPAEGIEVRDGEWPRWVTERKCPAKWFRPRTDISGGKLARALEAVARKREAQEGIPYNAEADYAHLAELIRAELEPPT